MTSELVDERIGLLEKYAHKLGAPSELLGRLEKLEDKVYILKEFFTIDEVCDYTGLAKSTVYKLCCSKQIPHWKAGKFVYFDKKDIDGWIYANKRQQDANSVQSLLK